MLTLLRPCDRLSDEDTDRGLTSIVRDGLCSQAMGTLTTGVILVGYALALGANNAVIGLLAAIPFLTNMVQVPAVLLVEKLRARKAIVVTAHVVGRSIIVLLALLPLIPDIDARLALLIAGVLIHGIFAAVSSCSWNSWMRDLVPQSRLGSYFGRRLFLTTALAAALSLVAGLAIDGWGQWQEDAAVWIYSIYFAAGGTAGLIGVYFLSVTPEPRMPSAATKQSLLDLIQRPFGDKNFRRLILFLGPWNFAVNLAAPFFAVYMLTRLGFEMTFVILVTVISQVSNMAVLRIFGTLSDRLGNKSILSVSAPLFIACIFAWTFTTLPERHAGTIPLLVVIHILMGFATAGVTLASSNIGLKLAPPGEATPYLATVSLVNSVAAGFAPILGGLFADFFARRELALVLRWTGPNGDLSVNTLSLRQWDFFFLLASVLGLYSLHRLTLVREDGEVDEKVVLQELMLEARRIFRNLSTVGGLRGPAAFPFGLLMRPRTKANRNACRD